MRPLQIGTNLEVRNDTVARSTDRQQYQFRNLESQVKNERVRRSLEDGFSNMIDGPKNPSPFGGRFEPKKPPADIDKMGYNPRNANMSNSPRVLRQNNQVAVNRSPMFVNSLKEQVERAKRLSNRNPKDDPTADDRSAKPELAKWILNPAKLSLHEFLEAQVKLTKSWLVYNRESMKINEDKIARTVLKGLSSQLPHCDHPEPQKAKKKYDTTDKLEFKTPRGPKPNIFSEEERMALLLKPIKRCEPKIWARIQDGLLETFSYYARADVTLDPMLTDEAMYWTSRKQWEMFAQGFDLATVTGISMNDLVEFYGPQREPVDFAYFVELMGEVSVKTLEWWLEKPIDSINVYAEPDGQVALGRMGEILGLCDENKSFRQYLRGRQNIRPIVRGMPRNSDSQAGSFPEGKGYNDGKGKGW